MKIMGGVVGLVIVTIALSVIFQMMFSEERYLQNYTLHCYGKIVCWRIL